MTNYITILKEQDKCNRNKKLKYTTKTKYFDKY